MIDKIVYLSGSVLPSTAANSVHVMKMCQALAKRVDRVELVARAHSGPVDVPRLYTRYGVAPTFALKLFKVPRIRGLVYQWQSQGAIFTGNSNAEKFYRSLVKPIHNKLLCIGSHESGGPSVSSPK